MAGVVWFVTKRSVLKATNFILHIIQKSSPIYSIKHIHKLSVVSRQCVET